MSTTTISSTMMTSATMTGTLNLNLTQYELETVSENVSDGAARLKARREAIRKEHAGNRKAGAAYRNRSRRASRNLFLSISAVIIAVFVLIGLSAYAASIQHANNVLEQENAYLQAEIDSLNSRIVDETKVTKIERIATRQYGMIYPTSENCVVISDDSESGENLAALIRSEAYN